MSSTPRWRSWSPGVWKHSAGPKDLTKVATSSDLHSCVSPLSHGQCLPSPFPSPPVLFFPSLRGPWPSFQRTSRKGGKKIRPRGLSKVKKLKLSLPLWCVQGGGSKLKGVSNFRLFTETFLWACVSFYFCGKLTAFLKASGVQFAQSTLNPSLGYSLAHGYYKIIPKPLTESTSRLMYLRVYDSRDRSCKTTPSPSMTVLLTVNQMILWPISRRKYSHGS